MPRTATTATVDRAGLEDFLRTRHHVLLLTRRRSGGVQLSPVTAGLGPDGQLLVSSYPERAKVTNLRADPAVSACVLSDDWDGPWVQLDGTAEILDLPEALEPLVDYFRSIAGEHPDWADYRAAMARQGKCLIRMTIHGWGPVATGGFPPGLGGAG